MKVERLLSRLEKVQQTGASKWKARCPAHADKDPSLSIDQKQDGRILIHCFGGCGAAEVIQAVGLDFSDLAPDAPPYHRGSPIKPSQRISGPPGWTNRDSYYRMVLDLAKSDVMKGVHSSTKDMQTIQEAMDYFEAKKIKQKPADADPDILRKRKKYLMSRGLI